MDEAQSEYASEKLLHKWLIEWATELWFWLCAAARHTITFLLATVGGAVAVIYQIMGYVIQPRILWPLSLITLAYASFQAWRNERRLKEKAVRKILLIENSYAYGLDLGAIDVNRATVSNANSSSADVYEMRYKIHLLNLTDRPMRYQWESILVDGQSVYLGTAPRGAVIPAKSKAMYSFNGSFSTMVPENFAIPCRVRFHVLYGHPDVPWTRELRAVLFGTSTFGHPIFEHMREQMHDSAINRPSSIPDK